MLSRVRKIDVVATVLGASRLAAGASLLVSPASMERIWSRGAGLDPTATLMTRSLGYRDALVGGLLLGSGLSGRSTAPWFLVSAGADAADLVGTAAARDGLTTRQKAISFGGAALGLALGVYGAGHATRKNLATRKTVAARTTGAAPAERRRRLRRRA